MLTVNVRSNYKKLSRSLDQLGKKQLPFAFAKTLNETMKAVEKYTVARTYPRTFDVRNRAFFKASMFSNSGQGGTAVKWATKTKLRVSARDRLRRGNLQLHATGGTKRARSGRIAIPSRFTKATRGARGVRKALRPRAVVDSAKGYIDRDAHVMRSTSGMGAVVARSGCFTFCNPERGYESASGSMRTRNGSRGRYRQSYSRGISLAQ